MVVYESTKKGFVSDVLSDIIDVKIYDRFRDKIGRTGKSEISSWKDSMEYMNKVLNNSNIPDDSGVAIEYNIPSTSKRIDFILTGLDENKNDSAVIIELKRWDYVEKITGKDAMVKTYLGKGLHETTHPSYQAWSYAAMLSDFNETVQNEKIGLYPCAYLHNYHIVSNDPLTDDIYKEHIKCAPVYARGDLFKLREFISKYIKYGDKKEILYKIENGKLRPSKSLQDSLSKMLKGNREFVLIDEQKEVYEQALYMAKKSHADGRKRVLIVEGGPGTGKSVLAVNLLVELTKQNMICQYVTKNQAPRSIYSTKLKGDFRKTNIDNLFKGSGVFVDSKKNEIDALIVDEAHRLNEKSGMFMNKGENQIKEIINTAKFSVFFIDESQRIHIKDIGSTERIKDFVIYYNAELAIMELASQFRCNGSDGYLAWVDHMLQIRETANFDGFGGDYDFRIIDDPNKLRDIIFQKNKINNKARLLAGYCWNWDKEKRNNTYDHDISIPEYNFSMSWNLGNTQTWAIDPESVNEIGCIHTSQGLEFDYVGVIIGPDMSYSNGRIVTDFNERAKTDQSLKGIKNICKNSPEEAVKIADEIIKNTYRTLLTRGQKACYVYCTDKNLAHYLMMNLEGSKTGNRPLSFAAEAVDEFKNE